MFTINLREKSLTWCPSPIV